MNASNPVAFLSYARSDDEHDRGRITSLRMRLEGEVRMQTGRPFSIFQDNKDIVWGQQWKERLDTELFNVTFLIPVVTPSYFNSDACREEFVKFQVREKQLGKNSLILPIYYMDADQLDPTHLAADPVAQILSQRNLADWRGLRFQSVDSPEIDEQVALLAKTIKESMRGIQAEINASEEKPQAPKPPPMPSPRVVDISTFAPDVPSVRGRSGKKLLSPYYAYTQEFDEIITADKLMDSDSVEAYTAMIDRIDRKLHRTNSKALLSAIKRLQSTELKSVPQVVFLVDNSGSFREDGRMLYISGWLQIVVDALDKIKVPTEILGFTTKAWKGGESRELWLADNKPPEPGRLNDLRHIIYKSFEQTIEGCESNLGLMASGRLLKENIDGEALLWAFERTRTEREERSLIVMITDGAPVDDSTLASNNSAFLQSHLFATIAWLEHQEDVDLYGVGIEHSTEAYYPHGIPSVSAKLFGLELLNVLPSWLERASRGAG